MPWKSLVKYGSVPSKCRQENLLPNCLFVERIRKKKKKRKTTKNKLNAFAKRAVCFIPLSLGTDLPSVEQFSH